ncbi:unnamed protein product, partial [Mesorhabditis spiculigera]
MPQKPDREKGEISNSLRNELANHGVQVLNYLGSGSYADVFRAQRGNDLFAVKLVHTGEKTEYVKRFLPRELYLGSLLRHPNIVNVDTIIHLPKDTCMKLRRIGEEDGRKYFTQLLEALIYLENNSVVHRDLKCENILLDRYDNVKLGDFGFARSFKVGEVSSTFCGSRVYVAPEVLRGKNYNDNKIDIWSAGIVLYIMTTGVMPYDDRDLPKMIERQMAHRIRFPRMPVSTELKQLIHDILHPNPIERPSYQQMRDSRWLRNTMYFYRTIEDISTASQISERTC